MPNEPSFTDLHQALIDRYDLEELRTLCAQFGVPFDDLRGEGRSAKARELILWLQRRGRLDELIVAFIGQYDVTFNLHTSKMIPHGMSGLSKGYWELLDPS